MSFKKKKKKENELSLKSIVTMDGGRGGSERKKNDVIDAEKNATSLSCRLALFFCFDARGRRGVAAPTGIGRRWAKNRL